MAIDMYHPPMRLIWDDDTEGLDLLPLQGLWTEEQYLKLSDQSRRLIEFSDGSIEVLPMPTRRHQVILALLYELFVAHIRPYGGKVLFAPLRVRIHEGKFREPDLLLLCDAHDPRNQNRYWLGADLVVEIVSPDNPERDTQVKRTEYADAAIPEYWLVDPQAETVTVLWLDGSTYSEHGIFERGTQASSHLLAGFEIDVNTIFDAE